MKKIFSLLVAAVLSSSFAMAEQAKAPAPAKTQKPAKDEFVVTTITGKKIKIYGTVKGMEIPQYKGKVVMIEFWGTHCPPCRRSIPHYIDIMKKYGKNVALIAIEAQNTPKSALIDFAKSKGINYDVVSTADAGNFIDYVAQRAQWRGSIPFLIIVDKKGEVVTMQVGLVPEASIVRVLKQLIAK
jgi:thiol-disulfide isomerase/thioredoxin